jgi:hypothetical protein
VADDAAFEALARGIETTGGLQFRTAPRLVRRASDDPGVARLHEESERFGLEVTLPGFFQLRPVENAYADPEAGAVVIVGTPDERDVKTALALLLGAQHYPDLYRLAAAATGDPGLTLRALFAAAARGAADGGLGEAQTEPMTEDLEESWIEVERGSKDVSPFRTPLLAATGYLQRQQDRDAAFRKPPLTTLDYLDARRGADAEPVHLLEGPAPAVAGCIVEGDESWGPFRMMRALLENGGRLPSTAIMGWRGDRLVTYACTDARHPWMYVADVSTSDAAEGLRSAGNAPLPGGLPKADHATRTRERVTLSSGVPASALAEVSAWHETPLRDTTQIAHPSSAGDDIAR